jgi:hypothetical protein
VKCIGRLGHGRRKKPVPKNKFKNLRTIPEPPNPAPPTPTRMNTIPLYDFVDVVDINDAIDSAFDVSGVETPTTITGLRDMRKGSLINLAIDLGVDPSGTKEVLIKRLAEEIGIV